MAETNQARSATATGGPPDTRANGSKGQVTKGPKRRGCVPSRCGCTESAAARAGPRSPPAAQAAGRAQPRIRSLSRGSQLPYASIDGTGSEGRAATRGARPRGQQAMRSRGKGAEAHHRRQRGDVSDGKAPVAVRCIGVRQRGGQPPRLRPGGRACWPKRQGWGCCGWGCHALRMALWPKAGAAAAESPAQRPLAPALAPGTRSALRCLAGRPAGGTQTRRDPTRPDGKRAGPPTAQLFQPLMRLTFAFARGALTSFASYCAREPCVRSFPAPVRACISAVSPVMPLCLARGGRAGRGGRGTPNAARGSGLAVATEEPIRAAAMATAWSSVAPGGSIGSTCQRIGGRQLACGGQLGSF